jgi:hypothetical protein
MLTSFMLLKGMCKEINSSIYHSEVMVGKKITAQVVEQHLFWVSEHFSHQDSVFLFPNKSLQPVKT